MSEILLRYYIKKNWFLHVNHSYRLQSCSGYEINDPKNKYLFLYFIFFNQNICFYFKTIFYSHCNYWDLLELQRVCLWPEEMQYRRELTFKSLYFHCLSGGRWKRSQQWTRQSDIPVLRRCHAYAENIKRRHDKVCVRGKVDRKEQGTCTILSISSHFLSAFLQNKNLPIENTTDCLSTMATVCKVMLETPWVLPCSCTSCSLHSCVWSLLSPLSFQGVSQTLR